MIRKAIEEDMMFLFNLKNQSSVLWWSFNRNPVSIETHRIWFKEKMEDPLIDLYVVEEDGLRVGQTRFDIDIVTQNATVSIDISEMHRGKGFGRRAILESLEKFFSEHPEIKTVIAYIYAENTISQKTFAKAGFSNPEICPEHGDRVEMQYKRSS